MSQTTTAELVKELSELTSSHDIKHLTSGIKALGKLLDAAEQPISFAAVSPLLRLLNHVYKLNPAALEPFADQATNNCLRIITDVELRKCVSKTVKQFCHLRINNSDYKAALTVRTTLIELLYDESYPSITKCSEYFVMLCKPFVNANDVSNLDVFWIEAIEYTTMLLGSTHKDTALVTVWLGRWMAVQGDYEGARTTLLKAIEIFAASSPEYDKEMIEELLFLAETSTAARFSETVFTSLERARTLINKLGLQESAQSARVLYILGTQYFNEDKHEFAIWNFNQSRDLYKKIGTYNLNQHRILLWLARIYSERDEPELLNECYTEALELESEIPMDNADEIADNFYSIASFYSRRQDFKRAEKLLEKALKLKKAAPMHFENGIDVLEKELVRIQKVKSVDKKDSTRPLSNVFGEIEQMVGLDEVKAALKEHGVYMDFLRLRKKRGFESSEKPRLHAVFTGNPGTGKTTVAKLLGQIYFRLGLLSKGHVHTVTRADLIGLGYGSTEELTEAALAEAKGGVLFIDEAYNLVRRYQNGDLDEHDPGRLVIETLLPALTDPDRDTAIVIAGYPKEMEDLLKANPGFNSRFKLNIRFADYTPPQLLEIAINKAKRDSFQLSKAAESMLQDNFEKSYQSRTRTFGNARYVHSIIDDCQRALGLRCMARTDASKLSDEELSLIDVADVRVVLGSRKTMVYHAPINEKELALALEELNTLTGLREVKNFVNDLVKVVRVYRQLGKDVLSEFKLHLVFAGNPGTGKTSVARIVARIYRALGILDQGHLIECDRGELIGQWIGHSERQTKVKIEEALGGVLFIDEAYALMGGENDFGPRVLEVLLKEMEDRRGQFFLILAGYKKEMDKMLESNPGLRSRIDKVVNFEDYSIEELKEIALRLLDRQELELSPEALMVLEKKLRESKNTKDFANGRAVRNLIEQVVIKHFAALAEVPNEERTIEVLTTIKPEVFAEVDASNAIGSSKKLGF
ncbi:MAG: AAA family ATPase [Cyanobacteria bacterium SZAS-4]|nr:AAA family ATPase [Cyanobacteria bacterium SZAS-4]